MLSGNRPVAGATRCRVRDAVRKLGYRPNGVARSLCSKRSTTVALIVPDLTDALIADWNPSHAPGRFGRRMGSRPLRRS